MKWWPFGNKQKQREEQKQEHGEEPLAAVEPSAMDRLLSKNCSRDEFFLLYIKLLQAHMPDTTMEMIDDSTVRIVRPDRKESTVFMDNAWLSYSQNVEGRRELIEKYLGLANSIHEPTDLARERIVAMVKDSQYMTLFKPEDGALAEPLCGDLWIVYAEDLPDRMRSLKRAHLSEVGVAESELRKLAKENLQKIMPLSEQHGDGPGYLLTAGGDYTASLLLFDGLWDDLADSVDGDIVAVVPSRDVLLYTGSRSKEGIASIRQRVADVTAMASYLISETLIVRSGGKWDVFNAN